MIICITSKILPYAIMPMSMYLSQLHNVHPVFPSPRSESETRFCFGNLRYKRNPIIGVKGVFPPVRRPSASPPFLWSSSPPVICALTYIWKVGCDLWDIGRDVGWNSKMRCICDYYDIFRNCFYVSWLCKRKSSNFMFIKYLVCTPWIIVYNLFFSLDYMIFWVQNSCCRRYF